MNHFNLIYKTQQNWDVDSLEVPWTCLLQDWQYEFVMQYLSIRKSKKKFGLWIHHVLNLEIDGKWEIRREKIVLKSNLFWNSWSEWQTGYWLPWKPNFSLQFLSNVKIIFLIKGWMMEVELIFHSENKALYWQDFWTT